MSLQPIAIELCQGSALRGRRRSSIRPQNLLPLLFTPGAPPPNQNESAVADEACAPGNISTDSPSHSLGLLSPISDAHMSSHSSSFSTKRHHDALSTHKSITTVSPTVSPSDSALSRDSYFEPRRIPDHDPRLKWRLASALFLYFLNGWGDGVTGTALPYFREEFHLSYMTSSLLFVATTCGYTSGTLLVPRVMNFLGRFYLTDIKLGVFPLSPFRIALSKKSTSGVGHSASQARYLALILCSALPPTNFIMMGSKSGFLTMFMAYVLIAFGRSILTGLGAVASPLVFQATAAAGLPWAHFYFGSLVLAAVSAVFLGITFTPTAREFAMDRKNALDEAESRSRPPPTTASDRDSTSIRVPSVPANQLRLVASMPYQWAVSLFTLLYCGSETTTQGLIVQYLLAVRSADPNTVGYVTSGFWAGISASRFAWSYFSPSGLSLGMHLFIWFIDSTIENAVSAALIGAVFGPVFPACLELANDLLPAEVNMISMGIVSAAGSMGSAIFPFVTGVITTRYTMKCWSYITVAQCALLFGTWYLFPTRQPPRRAIAV
ncbi:MFS general substrate transporter [Mycena belliarum]|uniref:MFS general substrate transporter n=1 Tax=Mycena belliarum TaxID=1033014 RepID=A0AAD6UGN5_9AGAR|nr:MFS general substrate transporter [Mycena belliae]